MTISMEEMRRRLVRYEELIPCKTAFIDARTPGSDRKENFCIIGPGVAENPGQHVHVKIAHGFNIGGARQPKGCVNSQHSHETAEVFLVHSGAWAFRWGHDGKDGEVVLHPGDVISIPVNVFRGFECVSDEESFLFAILGGDDPGHVAWAPYVFEQAKEHGLVLTEAGRLIDTAAGQTIPEGDAPCVPTSTDDLPTFRRMTHDEMSECVVSDSETCLSNDTDLARHSTGVCEAAILGPASPAEGVGAAKVSTLHGFHFRKIQFDRHARIPPHSRSEEEVVFVHSGAITLLWGGDHLELGAGDTITVPKGLVRSWRVSENAPATLFIVRGADAPNQASWVKDKASTNSSAISNKRIELREPQT
ncbi:MAG: cupin domain-containing protein [Pseudomonadota bacterium]